MSVNLSARELEDPTLVDRVRAVIEASGVHPSALVLEITESVLMHDVHEVARRLSMLRELGVRVAIDDFGTGYSSLSRLRWLPRHPQDRQVFRRARRPGPAQRRWGLRLGPLQAPCQQAIHPTGGEGGPRSPIMDGPARLGTRRTRRTR